MDTVNAEIQNSLRYIVKLGNLAAHTSRAITYREAVLSLRHLSVFLSFIDYCYSSDYVERDFDESILFGASTTSPKHKAKEQTEAETRVSIIDVDLKDMGWTIGKDCFTELEVFGLPTTPSGMGYADYVLLGDDGKPLAVVEAKRSSKDVKAGKEQARQYADALEKNMVNDR